MGMAGCVRDELYYRDIGNDNPGIWGTKRTSENKPMLSFVSLAPTVGADNLVCEVAEVKVEEFKKLTGGQHRTAIDDSGTKNKVVISRCKLDVHKQTEQEIGMFVFGRVSRM